MSTRALVIAAVATIALHACSPIENREDFASQLRNKTEAEVLKFAGKPAEIERSNPERVTWVYKSRTFDVGSRRNGSGNGCDLHCGLGRQAARGGCPVQVSKSKASAKKLSRGSWPQCDPGGGHASFYQLKYDAYTLAWLFSAPAKQSGRIVD
jgi:hypothetical protein